MTDADALEGQSHAGRTSGVPKASAPGAAAGEAFVHGHAHGAPGTRTRHEPPLAAPADFVPTWQEDPGEVDALIERARAHPLGVDFLVGGYLGSVAAAFRTHAFTVEAARQRLGATGHR